MGTFEQDVRKTDGRNGGADVWMKGHLGWEYKGKIMTPDEEIERLDTALKSFAEKYPRTYGTLSITNTTFRACDKQRWNAYNWSPSDQEINGIVNGNDFERTTALQSLLRSQKIAFVKIVPGVNVIKVDPFEGA